MIGHSVATDDQVLVGVLESLATEGWVVCVDLQSILSLLGGLDTEDHLVVDGSVDDEGCEFLVVLLVTLQLRDKTQSGNSNSTRLWIRENKSRVFKMK